MHEKTPEIWAVSGIFLTLKNSNYILRSWFFAILYVDQNKASDMVRGLKFESQGVHIILVARAPVLPSLRQPFAEAFEYIFRCCFLVPSPVPSLLRSVRQKPRLHLLRLSGRNSLLFHRLWHLASAPKQELVSSFQSFFSWFILESYHFSSCSQILRTPPFLITIIHRSPDTIRDFMMPDQKIFCSGHHKIAGCKEDSHQFSFRFSRKMPISSSDIFSKER